MRFRLLSKCRFLLRHFRGRLLFHGQHFRILKLLQQRLDIGEQRGIELVERLQRLNRHFVFLFPELGHFDQLFEIVADSHRTQVRLDFVDQLPLRLENFVEAVRLAEDIQTLHEIYEQSVVRLVRNLVSAVEQVSAHHRGEEHAVELLVRGLLTVVVGLEVEVAVRGGFGRHFLVGVG